MNAYKLSVRKLEGKRPLAEIKHRWVDNIKMDLKINNQVVWIGFIWLSRGIG
jgi:hypothetical protein